MQFAVPQFTDIEDKLIGPLTLKQFFVVLGFGAVIFALWSVFGASILFFLTAIPFAGIGAYVTFKKFNGRPFIAYVIPMFNFLASPKVLVFKREPAQMQFTAKRAQVEKPKTIVQETETESTDSRLKKLSYLLDKKAKEEKEIIVDSANYYNRPMAKTRPDDGSKKRQMNFVPQSQTQSDGQSQPQAPAPPKKFNPSDIINSYTK